ncbi:MAG TPA: hypothetical protein VFE47_26235 [Tepidisphaeraceae bacterium]|jgi:hypothetical protein|nr:hypothetical protein [Tepidisphaeraceae bacterium]
MISGDSRRKLAVHGPVVQLDCTVPALDESIDALLSKFAVPSWPDHFLPTAGIIHSYDESEVVNRLPETARHLTRTTDMMDLYEDGERYWVVDDRWGMAEMDFAQSQWRSWIVPEPKVDIFRVAELAVIWPMAQLLRPRGVSLLPAISAVRDGFAVLIICPFGVEPELTALISNGYKIIGQRWTAVREEDGRLALLHIPGRVERATTPRLRFGSQDQEGWLDLSRQHPASWQNHAFCDAVLVVEPGRRAKAHLRPTDSADALELLTREWPIAELDRARRGSHVLGNLAESCPCFEVQLSRNTKDLLSLLNAVRYAEPAGTGHSAMAA